MKFPQLLFSYIDMCEIYVGVAIVVLLMMLISISASTVDNFSLIPTKWIGMPAEYSDGSQSGDIGLYLGRLPRPVELSPATITAGDYAPYKDKVLSRCGCVSRELY